MGIINKSIEWLKEKAKEHFPADKGYTDTTRAYLTRLQITKVLQLIKPIESKRKN